MKRIAMLILIFILLLMTAIGCSKGKVKNKDSETIDNDAKGRYVEEDIKFPEGIRSEQYVTLSKTLDGNLVLYVYNQGKYEKYLYTDKKWTKDNADELSEFNKLRSAFFITDVFYGEDEKLYILGDTIDYHRALYRLSDNGKYEKLAIKKFNEIYEEWNVPYRADIIKVLQNGMIVAVYQGGEIDVYSSDEKSVVKEFTSAPFGKMAVVGNTIFYTDESGNKLITYNMESDEQEAVGKIDSKLSDTGILEANQTASYLCDTAGIHLNKKGGSIWETIVDGNQTSLSMPSIELSRLVIGKEDDFFAVLQDGNNTIMKHYYYDRNASSVPPLEFSIFSIQDNKTIRQAIAAFQKSHPDVKINYRVAKSDQKANFTYGLRDPNDTISQADYISALNTELLAKSGADILVMDGLPIDSYIEKGVLEDMGSIFSPMIANGELLGIADNFVEDGKVYAMPARFSIPIIYGATEAVNSADSIENLVEYAHNNKEIPFISPCRYRSLAAWFLLLYYDQIINEKNEFNETGLKNFFDNMSILSDDIKASDDTELNVMGNMGMVRAGEWVTGSVNVHKKLVQTNIEELNDILDICVAMTSSEKWKGTYKVINNTYSAHALVGINSAGKQKELAKEFVQLLFSNEIQKEELLDGFPMNKAALEEWIRKDVKGQYTIGVEEYKIRCDYPTVDAKQDLYEYIKALSKPMVNDTTLIDMILDEAERNLRGEITAEEAANNATNTINTYLNE